eukprot:3369687-Amphidinium_carterae.1
MTPLTSFCELLPQTPEHWLEMSAAHMFMRALPPQLHHPFLPMPQPAYGAFPGAPPMQPAVHAVSLAVPAQPFHSSIEAARESVAEGVATQVLCLDQALSPLGGDLPSVGSAEHPLGTCKPCAFFHKNGCEKGPECSFCHLCDDEEVKKRKREKKDRMRELKALHRLRA